MKSFAIAMFSLCAAAAALAQAAQPPAATNLKHYRLTFVLSDPNGQRPPESFVLDVPVTPDRMGSSGMAETSGLDGQAEGTVQQSLQCTDVHASATGIAMKVAFSRNTVLAPLPQSTEPIHNQLNFDRKVDLVLGQATRITGEMHLTWLKKGDEALRPVPPAPTQITVTAVAM